MSLLVNNPNFSQCRFLYWTLKCLTFVRVGFVCLYLYKLGYQPRDVSPLLVYIFIPAFFGDVVRFVSPGFNRLWTRVMGPLIVIERKKSGMGSYSIFWAHGPYYPSFLR